MGANIRHVFTWGLRHPRVAATRISIGGIVSGVVTDLIRSGTQSYSATAFRTIVFGWHPFPAVAWCALGPLCILGCLWIMERLSAASQLPDVSQEVRWRCTWKRRRVVKLVPVCPNPNCGRDLKFTNAGGKYGTDAVLICEGPGCGFHRRYQETQAVVLAEAGRDLENQAEGKPTPEKNRKLRVWSL
jgi:hypothetical protein